MIKKIFRKIFDTFVSYVLWAHLKLLLRLAPATASAKRHVLLIADRLPPSKPHSGSYRPTSFLQYASDNGWRASAVHLAMEPPTPAGERLLEKIPDSIQIAFPKIVPRPLEWPFLPSINRGFGSALALFHKGRHLAQNDMPSIVLGTGPPFMTFVAAYYLSRIFSASLILDYRDEWTQTPLPQMQKRIKRDDFAWERRLLRVADAVLFTTASQIDHNVSIFPELDRNRCFLIQNGWEQLGFSLEYDKSGAGGDSILVSFIGYLTAYGPIREFIDDFATLLARRSELSDRVRVRFVGRRDSHYEAVLDQFPHPEMIERIDHVPQEEARRLMQESTILTLFVGHVFERYLPGKLFEYIASGTPILIFGAEGEASRLVERLGVGVRVADGDVDGLAQAVIELAKRKRAGIPRSPEVQAWLDAHRRDRIAGDLFKLLEELRCRRLASSGAQPDESRAAGSSP